MKYLQLIDPAPRKLPFYLAMEEFAARNYSDEDELFFMWQVDPTVIFGRNQMVESELDIDYCRTNNIEFYRRKSGGGCVFADRNNIMFSYITTTPKVATAFEAYTRRVTDMLRQLGLDANDNSRNDIMIGDRKVAGNAFYRTDGRSIVHGTMLYDTDMTHMTRALTPSKEKLRTKGVKSVRSRVTTIVEHLPQLSLADFKHHARWSLCGADTIKIGPDEVAGIAEIERQYYTDKWIFGNNPRGRVVARRRVEGAGEFTVTAELCNSKVRDIDIVGDFFITGDLERDLVAPLLNRPFSRESFTDALSGTDLTSVIAGLTTTDFIDMVFESSGDATNI